MKMLKKLSFYRVIETNYSDKYRNCINPKGLVAFVSTQSEKTNTKHEQPIIGERNQDESSLQHAKSYRSLDNAY